MIALDTNIWLYSHDKRDAGKQQRAQEIIRDAAPLALPWQVGCEFVAASRKLQPFGFTLDDAWAALDDMIAMADRILLPDPGLWPAMRDLQRRLGLSFWDGLIVVACQQGGARTLYSEDFGDRSRIDELEIINPFKS